MALMGFRDIIRVSESGFRVKAQPAAFVCGALMWLMLASNVVWSCARTFDCRTFWPTVSYVAAYRNHDRLYSFSVAYYAVVVLLVFPLVMVRIHDAISRSHKVMLAVGAILIALAVFWTGLLDEANGSHILPIEKIHYAIMVGLQTFGLLWVYLAAQGLKKAEVSALALHKYTALGLVLLLLSIYTWRYANDPTSSLVNENLEALTEWSVVTMCIFLPYIYTKTVGECWLELKTK